MNEQLIVSVGREFGSGGHAIAACLAERLNLKLYDHNLLDEIAHEHELDSAVLHKYDEKPRKLFLSRNENGYSSSAEVSVAYMQFDYMKKKAQDGESFVVVGRCAETVLQQFPGIVSFFILGDSKIKCARVMELYHLTEKEALHKMQRHDQYRKRYHNYFCADRWGDPRTYDLCINSSRLGIEGTTDLLEAYINNKRRIQEAADTISGQGLP